MPIISEIAISAIEPKFKQLIDRVIPNSETLLIVCYDSDNQSLCVITESSAAKISINNKNDATTIRVRLENVISIREETFSGFLMSTLHTIALRGHDAHAIVGFSFPTKNELYFKFTKILRDSHEKIKSSQVSTSKSPSERLREIDNLLASKLITEAEYKRKREEILGDL